MNLKAGPRFAGIWVLPLRQKIKQASPYVTKNYGWLMFNSLKLSYQICAKFGMDRAKKNAGALLIEPGMVGQGQFELGRGEYKNFPCSLEQEIFENQKSLGCLFKQQKLMKN